ncbi:uncharacterized protein LOC130700716 [Daphnia carinata]|uniref:uncharacterized protein LOC130700716 n=1 Tax=Daphnia carinata TaxID=120202 RepID=UPI002579801F|nr:uncharacterized protein LOC130700716 [Daphnia carinata]
MKYLVLVLFVALVAGNVYHQPFSPQLKPSWQIASSPAYHPFLTRLYYRPTQPKDCGQHQDYFSFFDYFPFYPYVTNIQQGLPSGQQRSPAAKKNDRDPSQDWQKVLKQRSRWNQKFFLLDNEAQTVHALRPFNPLEMFSYQINQIKPSAPLTRPVFARRTVLLTVTETVRHIDIQICIPSTLFTAPSNPTECPTYNRTIRHLTSYDDLLQGENIVPSSPSLVMPTILNIQSKPSPVYSIESSKDEDLNEDRGLVYYEMEELARKDRAMFPSPTTKIETVVATETSIETRAVIPLHLPTNATAGQLICVPPGLVVCA